MPEYKRYRVTVEVQFTASGGGMTVAEAFVQSVKPVEALPTAKIKSVRVEPLQLGDYP